MLKTYEDKVNQLSIDHMKITPCSEVSKFDIFLFYLSGTLTKFWF